MAWLDQDAYDVRCEWGPRAVEALAPHADVVVLVDVLSFGTCVDVAVARGALVHPWPWQDDSAAERARALGAVLAGPRGGRGPSLSPASMRDVAAGTHIVLPSPNGATISLLTGATPTLAGCLRNAASVARAAAAIGPRVAVIPAGERWPSPDGSLRPALEDWLGAGAIVSHLPGTRSPEADAARAAFEAHAARLGDVLRACASGRELIGRGWAEDVAIAAALDASRAAPRLVDGAYRWVPAPDAHT
jgi:2-phosphosulfolactate phosphatase